MKRKILAALAGATLAATLAACSSSTTSTGDQVTNAQQANQDTQYAYTQPLPYFPFSQIRQTAIEAEAIDALGIASTTFMFVPGVPNPVLVCPSIGVPVPVTDQLSNPLVAQWGDYNNSAGVAVGQEEPMGVFTGDSSGTNSLCVKDVGSNYLGYNEAYDVSVTAPAYWDPNYWGPGKGYIKITGTPVMPVCSVKTYYKNDSNGNPQKQYEEVCVDPTKPVKK